ncbi:MAG: metal ABC transporter permease [Rubrobacteraceae bacterium]
MKTAIGKMRGRGYKALAALLITPAAAASLLTNSLPRMMAIASATAVFSGFTGLYASYYVDVASGPAIVLTCTAIFGAIWCGWLVRQRLEPAKPPAAENGKTPAKKYTQAK